MCPAPNSRRSSLCHCHHSQAALPASPFQCPLKQLTARLFSKSSQKQQLGTAKPLKATTANAKAGAGQTQLKPGAMATAWASIIHGAAATTPTPNMRPNSGLRPVQAANSFVSLATCLLWCVRACVRLCLCVSVCVLLLAWRLPNLSCCWCVLLLASRLGAPSALPAAACTLACQRSRCPKLDAAAGGCAQPSTELPKLPLVLLLLLCSAAAAPGAGPASWLLLGAATGD